MNKGGVQPRRQRNSYGGDGTTLWRSWIAGTIHVLESWILSHEAETVTIELTECQSTEEGITGTTSNTLPSECVRIQTRAVPWMKARVEYRRPTTAPSYERERRREASDGNDAVRKNGEPEFTCWSEFERRSQHGMSTTQIWQHQPARSKNEGPTKTTTCGSCYIAHEPFHRRIEPTVGS